MTEQESDQMSRGCTGGTRTAASQRLEFIQPPPVLQSELKYTGMLFLTGANLRRADGTRQEARSTKRTVELVNLEHKTLAREPTTNSVKIGIEYLTLFSPLCGHRS